MNKTQIEWVKNPDYTGIPARDAKGRYQYQGYTWNPITGCLNHTDGLCKGGGFPCYAYKLANGRLKERYLANWNYPEREWYQRVPFYPRFWEDRLEPVGLTGGNKRPHSYGYLGGFKEHKPKGIFVCDMSDLFGIGIPEEWTQRVMDTIKKCSNHRFYLLTKQPQNLIKFNPFPQNVYLGVTVTNPEMFIEACYRLKPITARVKFLSFEPLLNFEPRPDTLSWHHWIVQWLNLGEVKGVIIGAQTKPLKRPHPSWVREITEAAIKAGIAVFHKNNLKETGGVLKIILNDGQFKEIYGVDFKQELPRGVEIDH